MCPFIDGNGYCYKNAKYCDECEKTECKRLDCIVDALYDFYVHHCSDEMRQKIRCSCWDAIIKYDQLPEKTFELMIDSFVNLQNDDEREHNLRYGFGCFLMLHLFKEKR